MDRALVHTETAVKETSVKLEFDLGKRSSFLTDSIQGLGEWYIDLPFEDVPESFIEQITNRYFPTTSIEEWRRLVPWLNSVPNFWNSCLVKERRRIIAFVYGDYDPLIRWMEVKRISIAPELFKVSGKFYKDLIHAAKIHARLLGAEKIYFITCRWKAFLRKAPELFKEMDTKVLEVI